MAGISAFRSADARAAYRQLYDGALATSTIIPVAESDIETSFGRTHLLNAGDPSKPPLVALHGSSMSSTMWVPLLPILAATHSVTMIDAIDEAGKSIATRPTTNSAEIVAWLDETLRAVDIQRSAIVAASRGTWIATHYTMAFPERVDRLALVCPAGIVSGLRPRWLVRALTTMGVRPTEGASNPSLTPWSCRETAGCFARSRGGRSCGNSSVALSASRQRSAGLDRGRGHGAAIAICSGFHRPGFRFWRSSAGRSPSITGQGRQPASDSNCLRRGSSWSTMRTI
jgi:pimeloyl-ACP methyl ester carboxylesterase